MSPKVSVLLAVFNGGEYLRGAIESVLTQTFTDFELLIVDDASTDGSIDQALRGIEDARVRVIRNSENLGQVPSLNRGLREAAGEYIARLDHDDLCESHRLAIQVRALDDDSRVAVVGAWATLIDDDGKSLGISRGRIDDRIDFAYWSLIQYVLILHPAAMFRRAPVVAAGGYDETMGPAEDKDLWRRLLLAGQDGRIVPRPLVQYRVHGAQLSQTRSELQRANDDRSQELLLGELAGADAPVRQLRLLLAGDVAVWQELNLSIDLRPWLDRLITATATRLGLSDEDRATLSLRIHRRVDLVARAGWRSREPGWDRHARQLLDWSATGGAIRWRVLRVAAPLLRPIDAGVAAALQTIVHLELVAMLRVRLRRSLLLRRVYSTVTRSRQADRIGRNGRR